MMIHGQTGLQGPCGPSLNYVVTGATGFIGREICAQLAAAGRPVRALVRTAGRKILPTGVEPVVGDVLEPESLEALFAGWKGEDTVCIHTAGVISVRRRDERCQQVNVQGTVNVLAACRACGVRRLVHFSSVDALLPNRDGTPVREPERFSPQALPTSYGRSKAMAAQLVLDAAAEGLDAAVVLPSAVLGPGDYRGGLITRMLAVYLRGLPPVSIGGGYDFVDVRDVAQASIAAAQRRGGPACYLLSGGFASVTEVFDTLAEYTGRHKTLVTLPLWTLYPLLPLLALWSAVTRRQPPITGDALRLMRLHPAYCHDQAARELGFAPRPAAKSVRDAAEFILAQRKGNA